MQREHVQRQSCEPGPLTPACDQFNERLYFLDWLRIIAFAVLIVYHVGMYYVRWDFHVKSPFAGPSLEPWMKLTEPWRMSLLFMISGAATALMLRTRSNLALVRQRSRQLLLPLLCGVVLIVPPQAYFEVVQKFSYPGSYRNFLALYFGHDQSFCQNNKCLILPTWNHLWFLPYVWAYTMLYVALNALSPRAAITAVNAVARVVKTFGGGIVLLLVPMAFIGAIRWALFARFPVTYALWGDWFSHAIYAPMFFAGAVLALQGSLWTRVSTLRWTALGLAAVGYYALIHGGSTAPMQHLATAVFQWAALVTILGFATQHLNHDGPWRLTLNQAVFPVYLLHQTVIVVASQALLPLAWRPIIEGPVLIGITLLLSTAGFLAVRPFNALRPWFGLGRAPKHRP
jgi:glucans biosynthesis protein C